ncbi:MAG: cyclomaltodextrinase [Lachnospiraceae bacterium]|nr:cyclomaltodextrinase [Lachnospiraceae bacterium]
MWAYENVIYQIYPLGMCGAPFANDGNMEHRILRVKDWIPHLKKLGIGCVLFNPLFESDSHGYDTRDMRKVDCRLGDNEDLKEVCDALNEAGIRCMLDGVFNHVGRNFFAFADVRENKQSSRYAGWFNIDFGGNTAYNDGFYYEPWEGHYELVKLNLRNEEVVQYIFDSIKGWVSEFGIDGLRLDVAYCLDKDFIRRLRGFTATVKEDFFLMGETLFGDYNMLLGDDLLHSVTNYECYKGLHSSLNSMNLFEIIHSLIRQFGSDPWCLYRGKHLMSFVDNHDVTRAASILNNEKHLPLLYALMFGMPGIPSIYYGSEWGVKGRKEEGDPALRPDIDKPEWNELTDMIQSMIGAFNSSEALQYGSFRSVVLTNRQCIFELKSEHERVLVAINADEVPYHADFDAGCGMAVDLLTGKDHDFGGGSDLPAYSAAFWKCEK